LRCGLRRFSRLLRSRQELEAHLVLRRLDEEGLELAALLRHEVGEQVRFARGEQLLHLLALDRLLQDHAARAEIAALLRTETFLARVGDAMLEHAAAALGAVAQRLLPAEIGRRSLVLALAEVELDAEVVRELQAGGKRPAHLAAKTVER